MVCTWIASRQRCCVSVVGDRVLYVWFFDHIGVFVVVFVFVIVGFHLLRPPDRGDFVRSTVYYGWIGLWCVAG